MKYDFTSIMERRGKDAAAVDALGGGSWFPDKPKEGFDVIPMWVADMNFPTCPTIPEAIIERAKHPAYGYFFPTEVYYKAIIQWHEKRNGVTGLKAEHIGYENGVLGGVVSALNVLCSRGGNVLIHSPTYSGFTSTLTNNGYNMIHSSLEKDAGGVYRMDFEDMEKKIVENKIHAMVFCSPHNPTGRVWETWELEKLAALCEKYDVKIVSDEIWSDILRPGCKHIPTQSVNEWAHQNTAAIYAPSKTFNLAHYNSMNVLSMHALLGAYKPEGYEWVDELCQTIAGNVDFACDHISQHYKGVKVTKPQGTYMLFLDCTEWCATHGKSLDELIKAGWDVGVAWQDGRRFNGPCHIRMNLALPLSRVQEAFGRLDKHVFQV